jgi:hypothetical protein
MENTRVINENLKTYLVGAMETTGKNDEGVGWRSKLKPELEKRYTSDKKHLYVFDPTMNEEAKIGLPTKEFHAQLHGWLQSGNKDKVREMMEVIWKGKTTETIKDDGIIELNHILGDLDYVRHSDFLILKIDEGDRPCGTYGEAIMAYNHNIPIYLIQTMPLTSYNKTLLGWVMGSNGEMFPNQKQLLEFLDKEYRLKVKKEKKTDVK